MGTAPITVNTDICVNGCTLTLNWIILEIIFVSITISIWSVCCIYKRQQKQNNCLHFPECQNAAMSSSVVSSGESTVWQRVRIPTANKSEILDNWMIIIQQNDFSRFCDPKYFNIDLPLVAIEIYFPLIVSIASSETTKNHPNICLFTIAKSHIDNIASVNIYAKSNFEINKPINQVLPLSKERKLTCYCDGSYSHYMGIGHSGFRASNGTCRIHLFTPHDPKRGSTDAEVFAAYLTIKYALEEHYNKLIIYTDNTKVEQLLKCPKKKDIINYSNICQILNQYNKQQGNNAIQVVRIRGHTSRHEQEECQIKYEFAKIDRIVRKETYQYIKRWWNYLEQSYYYWYIPAHYSYYTLGIHEYYVQVI